MNEHVEIRYDGSDAANHVINAAQLSESLAGFSRILSTAYHFAATEKFVLRAPAQNYQVYVSAAEPKCVNFVYEIWEIAKQQQIFQGIVGAVAICVVTYVVAKAANRSEEMKHLSDALRLALEQNGKRDENVIAKLLATVDRMAESLRPAVRQAVRPVGESCDTVRIGGANGIIINRDDREQINSASPSEITNLRTWSATITELDRENGTGKVRLEEDMESRISVKITDPTFLAADNGYIDAFTSSATITLQGKAELQDGEIKRLFISDLQK
jgi:hypothetical protein